MKNLKALVVAMMVMVMFTAGVSADHKEGHKDNGGGHTPVSICHSGNGTNYTFIEPDENSTTGNGHGNHQYDEFGLTEAECLAKNATPEPTDVPVETPTTPVVTPVTPIVETPTEVPTEEPTQAPVETPTVPPTEAPIVTPTEPVIVETPVVETPVVTPTEDTDTPVVPVVTVSPEAPVLVASADAPVVTNLPDTGVGPQVVQRFFDQITFVIGASIATGFFTGITLQMAFAGRLDN